MNTSDVTAQLTVRYTPPLFPFRLETLGEALGDVGFVVSEGVESRLNLRVSGSGVLARKGDVVVVFHTDRNYVGTAGHSLDGVVAEFSALEDLIEDRLRYRSRDNARFYELDAQLWLMHAQALAAEAVLPTAELDDGLQRQDVSARAEISWESLLELDQIAAIQQAWRTQAGTRAEPRQRDLRRAAG